MKKKFIALALTLVMATGLVACGSGEDKGDSAAKKSDLKVGMVTDSGTIDDKSFNQGTWEGIVQAEKELGVSKKYLQPAGEKSADYLKSIGDQYDAGNKFIVTPGYKFETAVFEAQDKYKDAKFVIIDGSPNSGEKGAKPVVKENTVSIFFAEHESGFLAGVASAVQMKEAKFGFIGGLEIPSVQKFNWGFQQGVKYANENLGTKITINKEDVIYEGTFNNTAGGQQIAAKMYDRGVNVIFTAAGGTGAGAITEAKARAQKGKEAWVVGVDVDQYAEGIYKDKDGKEKSIILTSATKKIKKATFDMIKEELDGKFQGGKTLMYDAKNDGVGIPEENPNLSDEATKAANDVFAKIKSGEIKVSQEKGDLIK
ncbi:MAG: BMP family ABC transporter substrate-binding protein [Clostridium baratii]|uniref:BMP family lipoprotein n=1 Tax=Clostridium baratii TaxID=1561 RepID=UPI0024325478|nr:BMP family ABC transporter substrate-binding protein [Clostridium baratii]MBS6005355.1 BMP family ABC transporter substrate-binding protein [Clostridium baratii]